MKPLPDLPKRFKSKADEVVIIFRAFKDMKDQHGQFEGALYDGPSPKHIVIAKHLSKSRKWQTFFHELLHVVEHDEGMELTEEDIDTLATGLLELFIRNGWELPQ